MSLRSISELSESCFEGIVPAMLATCSCDGMPHLTWLSQVFRVDERHVALSCQFFRKTHDNLSREPRAQRLLVEPVTIRQFRLDLRFARRETSGPVFERMAKRIQMIAALTHTEELFALKSADVFEVMQMSELEQVSAPVSAQASAIHSSGEQPRAATPTRDPLTALARITEGISACRGLEPLVQSGLEYLTLHLGLDTVCLYLCDPAEQSLYALASRGYPHSGIGATIAYGVGLVGAAAQQRMPVRVADMARELRYGRVVREQMERAAGGSEREVPLPGLEGVSSLLAVPLILEGELFGVLSTESKRRLAYEERDVLLLQTAGQVLAQAVARALDRAKEEEAERSVPSASSVSSTSSPSASPSASGAALRVKYYEADDSVFLDGEYLIKGLPGRILWLLLTLREQEGRDAFLNRELRLHPLLKLPGYRDNLEARLLMLQRRLLDKRSALLMSREQRGRLTLSCDRRVELELVPQ